jgi:hypothetical protein
MDEGNAETIIPFEPTIHLKSPPLTESNLSHINELRTMLKVKNIIPISILKKKLCVYGLGT